MWIFIIQTFYQSIVWCTTRVSAAGEEVRDLPIHHWELGLRSPEHTHGKSSSEDCRILRLAGRTWIIAQHGWRPATWLGDYLPDDQSSLWMRRWGDVWCLTWSCCPAGTTHLSGAKGQMSLPGWAFNVICLIFSSQFPILENKNHWIWTNWTELIDQNEWHPPHVARGPVDRHPDFQQENISCPF